LGTQASFGALPNLAGTASRALGAQMTEGGALRPPAVDRRATDLESSRCLGAGHAAIESCEHSDTKVFGVGFHASQYLTFNLFALRYRSIGNAYDRTDFTQQRIACWNLQSVVNVHY